jgi:lipopolysaccharide/colanic/teichoic acid biosynthesis glycosyltransferase
MDELPSMGGKDRIILLARPGLTGLWQVSGRNATSFAERLDYDAAYVQECSPALDLQIVLRTIPTVLSGVGAS